MRLQVLMSCVLAATLVGSPVAQAGAITGTFQGFGLFKQGYFEQTGPASVSTSEFTFFASALETDTPTESITAVDLLWNDGGGAAQSASLSQSGPQWSYYDPSSYSTMSDLTDMYPAINDFQFEVTVDGIGVVSEPIDAPDDLWPPMVPRFNNYNEIISADPAADLALIFSAFAEPAGASLARSRTALFDNTGYVWDDSGDETLTTTTIPGGTMTAGKEYRLILEYEVRYLEGGALPNFTDASYNFTWNYTTQLRFTAMPAPGTGLGLAALGGALAIRRRR